MNRVDVRIRFAFALCLTGLLGGMFALQLRALLHAMVSWVAHTDSMLTAFRALPWWGRIVLPAAGGLCAGTLGVLAARRTTGQNVADILEAVALGRGRVSVRTALWKSAGSLVAMATGGSVGREGPIVQFGAGLGGAMGRVFQIDPARVRVLIASGTAAGFCAAYNTPLTSVLFVLEIVAGALTLELIAPVVIAACVSVVYVRAMDGAAPLYGLRTDVMSHPIELVAAGVLGLCAGFLGPLFLRLLALGEAFFRTRISRRPVRGLVGGLGVGLLAAALPEVMGNGQDALRWVIDKTPSVTVLLVLLIAKATATTSSVTSGSPGGIFTPAMVLGASLGGVFGHGVSARVSGVSVAASVLVGMGSMAAATTHAPLMASVLVIELTGDLGLMVPLLLSTVLASFVSSRLRPGSVYTEELRRRGVPWDAPVAQRRALAVRASDILERDPCVLSERANVSDAVAVFARGESRVIYVVRDDGLPRAVIARTLLSAPTATTLGDIAREVPWVGLDARVPEMAEKLWTTAAGEVAVMSNHEIVGVVTWRGLLGMLDRELLERDLLMTRVVWHEGEDEASDYLELPPGHRVELIAACGVGEVLDARAVRSASGVSVLAVRRAEEGVVTMKWLDPDHAGVSRASDLWLVVGATEKIEALRTESRA